MLKKILVVQTASIGDVILTTSLLEKLYEYYPDVQLDILVRKGNEVLFVDHPFLHQVLIWNKKEHKYRNLLDLVNIVRDIKYDLLINVHRHFSSGFLAVWSKAKKTIGFNKNPLSFLFNHRVKHCIKKNGNVHEIERNHKLIARWTDNKVAMPKLYPGKTDFAKVSVYKTHQYICIAPASLWFTKQFPKEKWIEFLSKINQDLYVYFLGVKEDEKICSFIINKSGRKNCLNLSGKLSLLESSALMRDAKMNFVNDSAPLHLASAMNAPTAAVFCSTVSGFGFTPLADNSKIIETKENLKCRPCGLYGLRKCPDKHFKCGLNIEIELLLERLK